MKRNLKSIDLNLIGEFVLSVLILLMGIIIMIFKSFGLIEVVLYGSLLFYIYAVLSTIFYFVGRREGDYELLLLSLINIITATFMFIFKEDNPAMILGAGMTIFTILVIANRGVKIIQLRREDNYIWIVKSIVTFLIGILGMLITFNLFNTVTDAQTLVFGYYFISLGFMLALENAINIFITNDKYKKILSKVLDDEPNRKLESINEQPAKKETPKTIVKENKTETKKEKTKKEIVPTEVKIPAVIETKKATTKKTTKPEVKKEEKTAVKTTTTKKVSIPKVKPKKVANTTPKKETKTKSEIKTTAKEIKVTKKETPKKKTAAKVEKTTNKVATPTNNKTKASTKKKEEVKKVENAKTTTKKETTKSVKKATKPAATKKVATPKAEPKKAGRPKKETQLKEVKKTESTNKKAPEKKSTSKTKK